MSIIKRLIADTTTIASRLHLHSQVRPDSEISRLYGMIGMEWRFLMASADAPESVALTTDRLSSIQRMENAYWALLHDGGFKPELSEDTVDLYGLPVDNRRKSSRSIEG